MTEPGELEWEGEAEPWRQMHAAEEAASSVWDGRPEYSHRHSVIRALVAFHAVIKRWTTTFTITAEIHGQNVYCAY